MLGVFALVVMTSVLDGVIDKVSIGFSGMSWDGTVVIQPKAPETTEEQKRFAMSPGLRYEDLVARHGAASRRGRVPAARDEVDARFGRPAAPSASWSRASRPTTRSS